jgi:hypothetical protein
LRHAEYREQAETKFDRRFVGSSAAAILRKRKNIQFDARVRKQSMRIVAQPARGRWKTTVIKIAKFPRMSTFKNDSLPQIINYCRLTSLNVNCRFALALSD